LPAETEPERFELLIFLDGHGNIAWRNESAEYAPGHAWLIPAALGNYCVAPHSETKLLHTYLPDLDEFEQRMAARRIEPWAVSRVVRR
jgi:hypothetical protein